MLQNDVPLQREGKNKATHNTAVPHWTRQLAVLARAYHYASDLDCDVWQLAVEIESLRSIDVTNTDLRWLLLKGYIVHAVETTLPGESTREFRVLDCLNFASRSCFVLTEEGSAILQETCRETVCPEFPGHQIRSFKARQTPLWVPETHELRLGEDLVKQFKLPSPNQEAILMAFEEENWPIGIDDPIPPSCDQDSKQRLRDTIKSLNRNQRQSLIRFRGDGTGQRVLWELSKPPVD